ncbi:MAG: hypothetical protein JRI23_01030 [Deltaproteobacteria bacterium]|jgi:hypothetical protein|nr:hypothetical protein [Deltaproteobacteria bacterium]MBW2530037.1 hypothetical protein [Deltaproteobacteria bacterium]
MSAERRGRATGQGVAVAAGLLVALASVACGARDEPREPPELADVDPSAPGADSSGSAPGGSVPLNGCLRCDGYVQCSHCYIQGEDDTFRCPPGVDAPEPGCMNLDEWHLDHAGRTYTCFYCD